MNIRFNLFFKLAAASMFAGTLLGARFGHVGQLDQQHAALFQKAQLYNVTNSLGLFACSLVSTATLPLKIAGAGFILGQLLFITPLYVFALKEKHQLLAKIVPAGGASMLVGWGSLIFAWLRISIFSVHFVKISQNHELAQIIEIKMPKKDFYLNKLFRNQIWSKQDQIFCYKASYQDIKINLLKPMLHKKMSLTVSNRSKVKGQVDQLLNADYELLNQREDIPNTILDCQIVKRNELIHKYIQAVQQQYSITSPLKFQNHCSSSKIGSYNKIKISLKSSKYELQSQLLKTQKIKKRLTVTSKINPQIDQRQHPQIKNALQTPQPKLGILQLGENSILNSNLVKISEEEFVQKRLNLFQRNNSRYLHLNHLDSKEKPMVTNHSNQKFSSASNIQPNSATAQNQQKKTSRIFFTYRQPAQRKTIKKGQNYSSSQSSNSRSQLRQTVIHRNPINDKIQTRIKIQTAKPSKTNESYRYCVGCQEAVLQANIKLHEKECVSFNDLSGLSNEELYELLKKKLKGLESSIPKNQQQLQSDEVQHFRSRSLTLVKQSENRRLRCPQTEAFTENYDGVMKIGKKFTSALEEINKLRWFTRIVEKLEQLLQNP